MSRPLQPFCVRNINLFWGCCLATAALFLALAGCGNADTTPDTSTVTILDTSGDADVHVNHDTKDTATGPDADVLAEDVPDVTDQELPDIQLGDGDGVSDTVADVDAADVGLTDIADDGDLSIGPDADTAQTDVVTTDVNMACEFSPNALTGEPGATCAINDDCNTGYCVDTPDGKVCTRACTDTCCPGGWDCKNISVSSDPWYGCVPKLVHPCDPCTDDTQCHSPGDSTGLCLSYGDVGSFCGGSCASGLDSACPIGYYCLKNAKGMTNGVPGTGGTGNQCMKKSGLCDCSVQAKALGSSTICYSKNKYGNCTGARQCQLSGLTGCDAKSPTAEVCNGLDDNCDGVTDEPGASLCTVFWQDSDKDGFGNSPATGGTNECLCQATGLFTSISPTDCDDTNPAIKPTAIEVCDGVDNDCNGKTDETCDMDHDGYCAADAVVLPGTKSCKYKGVDCDDGNPAIHPGQPEICGNGIDDNCDGYTDSGATDAVGCTQFYEDDDKDGVGTGNSECLCAPSGIFTATVSGDCNDSNASVYPGAKEICGNGIDDNCNGKQDEAGAVGCTSFYMDADLDGYGAGTPKCLCGPTATYITSKGGDCNDSDPKMNPAMTEICNNIDDDCDGITDNNNAVGCTTFYADYDKDGFGDSKKSLCLCSATAQFTATIGGDCDDSKANVNPVAPETCDGLDNDCDGIIDNPGAQGCVFAYIDADGDGFGSNASKACVCGLSMPYNTFKNGDCDDKLSSVYPGALEKCNGIDDNCDGVTDEANAQGCTIYYADTDNDGIGNAAKAACLCAKNSIYTTTKSGDCVDNDPTVYPGAKEVCDGKDNDCDGIVDNQNAIGCNTYYLDFDADGYGDVATLALCFCSATGSYDVLQGGDCNDKNSQIHPGVTEKCDGLDNDCDGIVDPPNSVNCHNYAPDLDNDGYGDKYSSNLACLCGPAYPNTCLVSTNCDTDCNDKDPLISPGAFEICGDGIDNNCNGLTDEATTNTLFYIDVDGDGYGTGPGQSLCKPGIVNGQMFSASQAGDCNDALKDVHPNATEICNGIDDNCNGQTDEQLPSVMCGPAANGVPACIGGQCIPQCYPSWFDANGIASDGCECKADNFYGVLGATCAAPIDLGYIYDDGTTTILKSGNIMPPENLVAPAGGDWFHFKAVDASDATGSCNPFNVHVWLSNNPDGQFTVDLYKHGCGGQDLLCSNESDTGWTVSFSGKPPYGPQAIQGHQSGGDPGSTVWPDGHDNYQPSPVPENGGECDCVNVVNTPGLPSAGLPGMNYCTDNSDDFYVRVGRYPGSATICQNYTLSITNGK